jgi:hypothetical protein
MNQNTMVLHQIRLVAQKPDAGDLHREQPPWPERTIEKKKN